MPLVSTFKFYVYDPEIWQITPIRWIWGCICSLVKLTMQAINCLLLALNCNCNYSWQMNKSPQCIPAAHENSLQVNPTSCQANKDFAEISAFGKTWPDAKIQLCWWHLSCAVMQRLAKASLRTSEYDANAPHEEFHFIPTTFHPNSWPNPADNEGYSDCSDDKYNPARQAKQLKKVTSTQPQPPSISSQLNLNVLIIKLKVPISTWSQTQPLPVLASVDLSAEI